MNKALLSALLSTGLITGTMLNTVQAESEILSGDVNADNEITSNDALIILQAVADIIQLTEEQTTISDTDNDGEITSADALKVLQYVVGLTDNGNDDTTTKATEPPVVETPSPEQEYIDYYNAHCDGIKWGCSSEAQMGFVQKQLDEHFWDYYNSYEPGERTLNYFAENYMNGDYDFARTFLKVQGIADCFQSIGGIPDGNGGYIDDIGGDADSAYQHMVSGGDCGANARIRQALWQYLGYACDYVVSDSWNHAFNYVNGYYIDGQSVRVGDAIPNDCVHYSY